MLPEELKYDYMINSLASKFGLSANKCSEYDFWLNFAFERLDNLTKQYEQLENE